MESATKTKYKYMYKDGRSVLLVGVSTADNAHVVKINVRASGFSIINNGVSPM